MNNCVEKFKQIYGREPDGVQFTPYRICPIGAHIDHQLGNVTGFAIDKGIYMAYGIKRNGIVELFSLQFQNRAQFAVNNVPEVKQNDWADYLRGATIVLSKYYHLSVGMCAVICGELPIGGLSSSASVTIGFLTVLCKLNDITLSQKELIDLAQEVEISYVGVSCGKLDQSCEVYCKKNSLLYLDIKTGEYRTIPQNEKTKPYEILLIFSGLERSLVHSQYNMRADECKSAAYCLMAFSNMQYGKFKDSYLRDVPKEVYEKYKDKLPKNWQMRAEHFYQEMDRVERGALAWEKGDIQEFGKIIFESGKSSIENYQTGCNELNKIYDIMTKTDGVYGGRFSGAGFKGCCIAFIDPTKKESIIEKITKEYCDAFPNLKEKFSICSCKSNDGVEL